jgi:hypothetical protein
VTLMRLGETLLHALRATAVPLLQAPRERPADRPAAERCDDLTASQSPLMLSVCRLEWFARGKGTAFHSNR